MERVLVTGAAGFIGSHVAEECVKLGMDVVGVDDLSGGFEENVPEGVDFREGDLRDPAVAASLWRDGRFDVVYHLAAYAAEGLSHFIRRYNYGSNVIASVNLINEAVKHDARCFVFTSSIAVYGRNQVPMTESLTPEPEDPYGIAKLAVEMDLRAARAMFGLNHVIFRPHNVYGERQNISDKYRNVIGIFMNRAMQGQSMPVSGDGEQTRAFSYIGDVAPVIARSPQVPAAANRVFNVGADRAYTINELAAEVAAAMGVPPNVEHLPARNEVVHAFSDHSAAGEVFGHAESTDLKTGLARMAEWVRQHGPRPPVVFKDIEVEKGLPPSWRGGS